MGLLGSHLREHLVTDIWALIENCIPCKGLDDPRCHGAEAAHSERMAEGRVKQGQSQLPGRADWGTGCGSPSSTLFTVKGEVEAETPAILRLFVDVGTLWPAVPAPRQAQATGV